MSRLRRAMPVATSVFIHGAILGLSIFVWTKDPPGTPQVGTGGLEVSLGPMGGAPGETVTATVPEVQAAKPEEAEIAPETPVETVETERPPEEMQRPVEMAELVEQLPQMVAAAPVQEVTPPPVLPDSVQADVVLAEVKPIEPPRPIPPPPEIQQVKPVEPKVVEARPVPPPPPPPRPRPPEPPRVEPVREEPKPVPQVTPAPVMATEVAVVTPAISGAQGRAGNKDNRETDNGNATTGGGMQGASADYLSVLRAWLEKHKEYPRQAQVRGQQGTALLHFVMDRQGKILSYRIERSSGYTALDHEVEEMLRRASPLPAMPSNMNQAELVLVVPIQFQLR